MDQSAQLDELLNQCLDAEDRGEKISLTEVCHKCPELRPMLERHLQAHRRAVERERELGLGPNKFGSLRLEAGFEPRPGYRLVECLGGGASGEVWKAEREGRFHVALKFISLKKHAGKRELASLEWVKTLRHGNLLTVSAYWFLGSVLVIETELADYSLGRWRQCRDQGLPGIPVNELIGYLSDVAEVLDDLHKQGIVHRDIKPENILVKGGKARLGDLGVILFLSDHDPLRDPWCTREYAAPEVQRGGEFNATTDQYALLVTYCELLTGDYPYELVDRWPNYSRLKLTKLPLPQRFLVGAALADKPEQRWPDCRSLVKDLRLVAALADIESSTWATQFQTYRPRHVVALGMAIVFAAVWQLARLVYLSPKLIPEIVGAWSCLFATYCSAIVLEVLGVKGLPVEAIARPSFNAILFVHGFLVVAVLLRNTSRWAFPYILGPWSILVLLDSVVMMWFGVQDWSGTVCVCVLGSGAVAAYLAIQPRLSQADTGHSLRVNVVEASEQVRIALDAANRARQAMGLVPLEGEERVRFIEKEVKRRWPGAITTDDNDA